jgi:hypothetical protein
LTALQAAVTLIRSPGVMGMRPIAFENEQDQVPIWDEPPTINEPVDIETLRALGAWGSSSPFVCALVFPGRRVKLPLPAIDSKARKTSASLPVLAVIDPVILST